MKTILYFLLILLIASCAKSITEQNSDMEVDSDTLITSDFVVLNQYKKDTINNIKIHKSLSYQLSDTIVADFNGDGFLDQAIYQKQNETSGIIIFHGNTKEKIRIGFGEQIAHMTDFNWVDYWGLTEDKNTFEHILDDENSGDPAHRHL